MNRVANCILMLDKLSTGRVYKRIDLANELGVNIRNIGEYKKELETCGYIIETTPGIRGGYQLINKNLIPTINFEGNEAFVIKNVFDYYAINGTMAKDDNYMNASVKVLKLVNGVNDSDITYKNIENGLSEKMLNFVKICNEAIKNKRALKVSYCGEKDKTFIEYKVHPYDIINFSEGTYLVCYSLKKNPFGFRNLKFSDERMKSLTICNDIEFSRDKDYNIEKYVGNESIFKGKLKNYTIIFDAESHNRVMEENISCCRKIEHYDDGAIEVNGQYEDEIKFIRYLLSFGRHVEVIKPQQLKDQISNELKLASYIYE
ncbi:MAG: WYL domain-containing protein [Erysipelotrichaceae bacterium]